MTRLILLVALLFSVVGLASAQQLVNPLGIINSSIPMPIGVASYGIANIAQNSGPYVITTNEIFGFAKINSIYTYNSTLQPLENLSDNGASLQLNAMINISYGGFNYTYWAQDVLDLNTSNQTYYVVDNVWNATTPTAGMSNSTLMGIGNVTNATNQTFYSYATNWTLPYTFPFYFEPVMRLSYNHGYPYLQFGYLQNGTAIFYDNATFLIPNSTAAFVVTPYTQTPADGSPANSTNFYDVELVYGGEASGVFTNFDQMNSLLWIGYLNNGSITTFPTVATFGADTEESALNLTVLQDGEYALVTTGNPDYNSTITLAGIPSGITVPPPPAPATVPTTTILPSNPLSSIPSIYLLAPLGIIVIGGLVRVFMMRRQQSQS